mgnify:CR=1 FL=1
MLAPDFDEAVALCCGTLAELVRVDQSLGFIEKTRQWSACDIRSGTGTFACWSEFHAQCDDATATGKLPRREF